MVGVSLILLAPIALVAMLLAPTRTGDPGARQEPLYSRPDGVPRAEFSIATTAWGLDAVDMGGADALSGGAALADLDADGDLDLVAANGRALALEWSESSFRPPVDLGIDDAVGVTVARIDADPWPEILIARSGSKDQIIWGAPEISRDAPFEVTELAGGRPSSLLIPVDLNLDGVVEIVRLGRGGRSGSPDVVWTSDHRPRDFTASELPESNRLSLAAAVADIDLDGLLDIWVTRDTGYTTGSDSLYSRDGNTEGPWRDVSRDLGTSLEVDGMGVTLADLNDDGSLDAYVSDIGENEILAAEPAGYVPLEGTGAGRIRPPMSSPEVVSSSWATGPADINLDGRLDLVVVGGGFPSSTVLNKIAGTSVADAEPPAILLGIGEGRFTDAWIDTGLHLDVIGRGLTLGDIDRDGDTDAVIVTTTGGLHALRNDSAAPSFTITLDSSCGEGVKVHVASESRTFTTVVPQFTYGGAHANEVIVGVPELPATLSARRGGDLITQQTILQDSHRDSVELTC